MARVVFPLQQIAAARMAVTAPWVPLLPRAVAGGVVGTDLTLPERVDLAVAAGG